MTAVVAEEQYLPAAETAFSQTYRSANRPNIRCQSVMNITRIELRQRTLHNTYNVKFLLSTLSLGAIITKKFCKARGERCTSFVTEHI